MSYIEKLLSSKGLSPKLIEKISLFIDDEVVLLRPRSPKLIDGLGDDQFQMYNLQFMKLTKVKNLNDIYLCDCGQLPHNCSC